MIEDELSEEWCAKMCSVEDCEPIIAVSGASLKDAGGTREKSASRVTSRESEDSKEVSWRGPFGLEKSTVEIKSGTLAVGELQRSALWNRVARPC